MRPRRKMPSPPAPPVAAAVPSLLKAVDPWLLTKIGREHSAQMRREVVDWVGNSAVRFGQLITLVLHGTKQQAQRASYPMTFAVEACPKLAVPYVRALLENLHRPDIHGGVIRNTMRLLRFVPIKPEYESEIFSAAFAALNGPVEIAVKSDSISVLFRLVQRFPEMRSEVELAIREGMAAGTAAYFARARLEFGIKREDW